MNRHEWAKEAASGLIAVAAAFGITPADVPLILAILIGLTGGTMAAWTRERQNGKPTGASWLILQMAAWLMIATLVWAFDEYPGLTVHWAGALAALGAFASREGLQALHKRTLREIEERKQ